MIISLFGINHKTAPIEIREKFYLNGLQQELLLTELKLQPKVSEAFVLSTCNRTEVYLHSFAPLQTEDIVKMIVNVKSLVYQQSLMAFFYTYYNQDAVEHLLRVSCGLDSLVIGEKQIQGQVKEALALAQEKNFFMQPFNLLANIAIKAGKRARHETDIDCGGSSISWAAITKAREVLGYLREKKALIIVAGEMSKLAVGQIARKGFKELFLMNRTHEHAIALADSYKGRAVPFCDIKEILAQVDFCICSSSAPHFILDFETVKKIIPLRVNQQLLVIDISMPRNIDPKVAQLKSVDLFSIDDLDSVVEKNMIKRQKDVAKVKDIIQHKLDDFYSKIDGLSMDNHVFAKESLRL